MWLLMVMLGVELRSVRLSTSVRPWTIQAKELGTRDEDGRHLFKPSGEQTWMGDDTSIPSASLAAPQPSDRRVKSFGMMFR